MWDRVMIGTTCAKLLGKVCPQKRREYGFFLRIVFLYFLLSFIYNSLRPLKITLVTSLSQAGAEVIPFLKVWGIIPGAVIFTYLVTRLSFHLDRKQIFLGAICIFLSYYAIFASFLLPYGEYLKLDSVALILNKLLPSGFRGFNVMIQHWYISVFYILCEIWSSIVMFTLFWGFVNEVTPIEKAPRFYPLINLGGNLASTLSGWFLLSYSDREEPFMVFGRLSAITNLAIFVIALSIVLGLVSMYLFARLDSIIENSVDYQIGFKKPKKKVVTSLRQSVKRVFQSKYLFCLLVLVLAYNLVFNLTDVLWSNEVKNYFGTDQVKMTGFIGKVTMYKGVFSVVLVIFAHFIISKFGWKRATLLTPVIILSTSLLFYPLVALKGSELFEAIFAEYLSTSLAWILVVLGGVQNALARGAKYSIYDSTREMAFIPLSIDEKRKGKAVIDGIASRIGKSSGSVLIMMLLVIFSNLQATIPYIAFVSISVTFVWVIAIVSLDKQMLIKTSETSSSSSFSSLKTAEK